MSEYVAMTERMAREEQDDINRKQGQAILDMLDARDSQGVDPLLEALHQAHRATASDAEANKE